MSSVMRRRRGVMEKLLCEMGFVAHNIPFSSQRRSGGERLRLDSNRCAFGDCYRKRVPLHTAKRFSPDQIMSDCGSCRISSANDGAEWISSLSIRHNQERQSDAKKAKTSSQGLNRAVLVSGGATLSSAFSFIARSACR